jgi:BP28CT (NUC211) domain
MFFKQIFCLPQKVDTSSPFIVECFNAFILKLNEETLRPIIVIFSKWAAKEPLRRQVLF